MDEIEDLNEKFRIIPGEITFNQIDLNFNLGEIEPLEIIEKQKTKVEIYDPKRNDRNINSIF